jgi:hypothetical protein
MALHEIAGRGFTHQILWKSAKTLLNQPETNTPTDGYFRMAGMLMIYFTLEAYLNLAGPRVDPEAWKNEREFFNSNPYRGTHGKLRRICEKIGITIETGKRPYQTIRNLKRLRDFLAHGRPESYAYEIEVAEGEQPDMFDGLKIYDWIRRGEAERALEDAEEFIEFLHVKIVEALHAEDLPFAGKALQFPSAFSEGKEKRT